MSLKLFPHGYWNGFIDNTDYVLNINFFIYFFTRVFERKIEIGTIEDSDILLELGFSEETFLFTKEWKYSFLFSGESYLNKWINEYDCILCGSETSGNKINMPLYIPYLHCSGLIHDILNPKKITTIPSKDICAIISNPNGNERNHILNVLEKYFNITYAGKYKNNVEIIDKDSYKFNSPEFINYISQFKFIISMENSRNLDTYITEKIIHGFIAGNIPIYWGSPNIEKYFNKDRFIHFTDLYDVTATRCINRIHTILNNNDEYLKIVNENIFTGNKQSRTLEDIIKETKILINK